ncbi:MULTISPECIES: hypothetical protein [unclassified Nocardioides]|uniref:hypothetical protein n=1 Tax=unclassified Nocardioides TaxID=2615069 RepID=UPI00114E69C7|nr:MULTISPECIES: hypothetical protein [unclassified Nocardioides]TQK69579.1 hypothetical protein FBY23_1345 [Nocardioides sp. SLBN-35]WGY01178.1 hypothetical protein QI633_21890 [Nocardioides sp. QY071]
MTAALPADRPASWTEALDRLEAHADHAEQMLRGVPAGATGTTPEPWLPPTDLGPLPSDLVPRARMLLARQQRLMAAIPGVLADNRRQQQVADRVGRATTTPPTPVYLDVTA